MKCVAIVRKGGKITQACCFLGVFDDYKRILRDQEVEGSNPFSPTLRFIAETRHFCYLLNVGSAAFSSEPKRMIPFGLAPWENRAMPKLTNGVPKYRLHKQSG
jgi:hypothetical protein